MMPFDMYWDLLDHILATRLQCEGKLGEAFDAYASPLPVLGFEPERVRFLSDYGLPIQEEGLNVYFLLLSTCPVRTLVQVILFIAHKILGVDDACCAGTKDPMWAR